MANWIVEFKTKADNLIHISIDGAPGSEDVTLTPAETPFTTEEEGREDLFVPVKCQTGYISVVTDDMNFVRTVIPTSGGTRTVIAVETTQTTSKTIFLGYVQPKLLSMTVWGAKNIVRIPVECYISGLKYKSYGSTQSFPFLNRILCNMFPDIEDFIFQCPSLSTSDVDSNDISWLNSRCASILFSGKNLYDVLQYICTFFGWTCRMEGIWIYFIAYRNIDARYNRKLYYIDYQGLHDINTQGSVDADSQEWGQKYLPSGAIASDKTKVQMTEGVSRAVVNCSITPYNEEITPDIETIKRAVQQGTWNPEHTDTQEWIEEWGDGGLFRFNEYYAAFSNINVGNMTVSGYNTHPRLIPNESEDISDWEIQIEVLHTSQYVRNVPYQYDGDDVYYTEVEHVGWLAFTTVDTHTFINGKLILKTSVKESFWTPRFKIQVGNLWYNPSTGTWTSAEPQEYMRCIYEDDETKYEIPVTGNLSGNVVIKFGDGTFINGFSLEFVSEETSAIDSSYSTITHVATTGVAFSKEKTMESVLSLKELLVPQSKNFLLKPDLTPRTVLYDGYENPQSFNPLQRLADEIAREMRNVGEMMTIDVLRSKMSGIDPTTKLYIEWFDTNYYPVSISNDWKNDVQTIRLLKRINESASS